MVKENQHAILQTLAYSDVFDYPLKKEELWRFLIGKKINKKEFEEELQNSSTIVKESGFYCFLGRAHIIEKRKQRKKISQEKSAILKKAILYLRLIPTVQLIGVSGALAMENADKDDDIDLFVIVKKNKLWMTRALLIIILELLGLRRRRKEKNTANKICLNMLINEASLCLPKEKQDLYGAHEVVQMLPLFERNNTYTHFIKTNLWVRKFLPNSLRRGITRNTTRNPAETLISVFLRFILLFSALEFFAKILQLWYMKKHQTTEVVSDTMLAFHPFDYRRKILSAYNRRLKKYKII